MQATSDWPNGIIWTAPFSLIRSRGKYLRGFGIHSIGRIDRDPSYCTSRPVTTVITFIEREDWLSRRRWRRWPEPGHVCTSGVSHIP